MLIPHWSCIQNLFVALALKKYGGYWIRQRWIGRLTLKSSENIKIEGIILPGLCPNCWQIHSTKVTLFIWHWSFNRFAIPIRGRITSSIWLRGHVCSWFTLFKMGHCRWFSFFSEMMKLILFSTVKVSSLLLALFVAQQEPSGDLTPTLEPWLCGRRNHPQERSLIEATRREHWRCSLRSAAINARIPTARIRWLCRPRSNPTT